MCVSRNACHITSTHTYRMENAFLYWTLRVGLNEPFELEHISMTALARSVQLGLIEKMECIVAILAGAINPQYYSNTCSDGTLL